MNHKVTQVSFKPAVIETWEKSNKIYLVFLRVLTLGSVDSPVFGSPELIYSESGSFAVRSIIYIIFTIVFWSLLRGLYCTVLYCTVLYCTLMYCIVLCCTVLCRTVLYCAILYCTALYRLYCSGELASYPKSHF